VTNKYTKLLISTLEADGHSTTVFLRRQSYTTTTCMPKFICPGRAGPVFRHDQIYLVFFTSWRYV